MSEFITVRFRLDGINPEPWTAGTVSVGRKGGKPFPRVSKNAQLANYQNAVREQLGFPMLDGDVATGLALDMGAPWEGPVELFFYLERRLDTYVSDSGRNVTKHRADSTNCQKALEDALQGILFKNDNQVVQNHTYLIQGKTYEPRIEVFMQSVEQNVPHVSYWPEVFPGQKYYIKHQEI